jgi:hypothetical protein
MKQVLLIFFCCLSIISYSQTDTVKSNKPDRTKKVQTVEASCGQCQFGMNGKGCELAVRIDGIAYLVDGTSIDQHGDAHAKDGFCEVIRKAKVQGKIANGRFVASYFKLKKLKKD